uniref:Ig-like domain-containing protein n=1 Tax=Chrysemys picta bellii TaxID=8478 RepID=A0A8C3FU79_CHRPI
ALLSLAVLWLWGCSSAPSTGREFLKPTVWVSPSRVVAIGGSVTIRCEGRQRSMEFFLRKAGHPNRKVRSVPDGTVAEFPIPSVGREDGGSYTCEYRSKTDQSRWSYLSNSVRIIVGEGSLPKPSISVSPGGVIPVGGNVTIRCRNQHLGMRILLYKAGDGNYLTYTDPAGSEAEFPITSATREQSGNYTCRYSNRTGRAAYSEPSDPVQIIVAGEGPSLAPCEASCSDTNLPLTGQQEASSGGSWAPQWPRAYGRRDTGLDGPVGLRRCVYRVESQKPLWELPPDVLSLTLSPFPLPAWDSRTLPGLSQTRLPAANTDPGLNHVPHKLQASLKTA